MTVSELLARSTSEEITEWKVLFELKNAEQRQQAAMNRGM